VLSAVRWVARAIAGACGVVLFQAHVLKGESVEGNYSVAIWLALGVALVVMIGTSDIALKFLASRGSADGSDERQRLIRGAQDLANHLRFILDELNLQPFDSCKRTDPVIDERFRITLWHFTKYLAAATPIDEGPPGQKLQRLVHDVGDALSHERKDLGLVAVPDDRRVIYAHQRTIGKQGTKRNAVDDLDDFTAAYEASFSKTLQPLIDFLDGLSPNTAAWERLVKAREGLLVIADQ
jgi:hypothetical protein